MPAEGQGLWPWQMGLGYRNVLQVSEDSEYPANDAWRPRSKKFSPSQGAVARSSQPSQCIACSRLAPHIVSLGCKDPQTAGRSG